MTERLVPIDDERDPGATAGERLTWLLERFLPADLRRASLYEGSLLYQLAQAYPRLAATTSSWLSAARPGKTVAIPKRAPAWARRIAGERVRIEGPLTARERRELLDCQRRLTSMLDELVRTGAFSPLKLGPVHMAGMIRPPRLGEARTHLHLFSVFQGSLLARMALATRDYLAEQGVERLRRCPFQESQATPPCAHLFLARKGQKFCSPRHTQRAMYLQWVGRGMPRGTRRARGSRRKAG